MKEKISAVYKISNKITGDFYIGSSKNIECRWANHKSPSTWKTKPNSKLYQDMQKYGLDNFMFSILAPVEEEYLRQVEQEFIDMLKPAYNNIRVIGLDIERQKDKYRRYEQSEKRKVYKKTYNKAYHKAHQQTEKYKARHRKATKKYYSRLCSYNGETLTLHALTNRFQKAGVPHATLEAKKYLLPLTN